MFNEPMPINPFTGLTALGFTRRGPIWPVLGGAPDDNGGNNGGGGGNGGDNNAGGAGGNNNGGGSNSGAGGDNNGGGGNSGGGSNNGGGGTNNGGNNSSEEAKQYTPAQINAIVEDRLARDRKARGVDDFDTYKQSHDELQQLKDKDLPEIDRLRNQLAEKETAATTATQTAQQASLVALQYQVAAAKDVPLSLAERLRGSTKEELEADADAFLAQTGAVTANGGRRRPDPNGQQGNSSSGGEKSVAAGAELFAAKHKKNTTTQQ